MRAPDDVTWEHANCPHHVHVSVVSVTAGDEFTTLETRVSRVLRGSLVRGQVVSFAVRLPDADDFGEGGVSYEWLSRQGHFEVCLTETLELPSVDSLWALDGPGDGVHLQLPPACTVCRDGFLERVVEGPNWAQRRPDLGCALAAGSVGLVGLTLGLGTVVQPVVMLLPVGLVMLIAGIVLTAASLRNSRSWFRCARCGAEITAR